MSRAKEIQERLNLQAKLQDSFAVNTGKVLGWLRTDNHKDKSEGDNLNASKTAFFQLPVMQTGFGLNLSSTSGDPDHQEDIHTVGEFIKSDKKVNSLSKKKQRLQHNTQANSIYRITKEDTKAMVALKRKMRKPQRENMNLLPQSTKNSAADVTSMDKNQNEGSESDENPQIEKVSKKKFGLLFENPKRRRK